MLVTSLRPSRDGKARIARLFNASKESQEGQFGRALSQARVFRSDPSERYGAVLQTPLRLEPGQIVTLRIE